MTIHEDLETRIKNEIENALHFCDRGLISNVQSLINGGNKFRAKLFYNTSRCFGYSEKNFLITIASALEILHRSTLIHDDLADKSSIRRGVRTLHTTYGDAIAIYVTNLLRDHTEKMLIEYPNIKKNLMKIYNEICKGQIYEIQLSKSKQIRWEDYEKIVELKSAGLGRFALETAYSLTHKKTDKTSPRIIAKTGALLFQIVDDIEDLLDNSQNISTDLKNGIKPAPWFFLSEKQKKNISSAEKLQDILSNSEVLQRTYKKSREYLEEINSYLNLWLPDNKYRAMVLEDINSRFEDRIKNYLKMRNGVQ